MRWTYRLPMPPKGKARPRVGKRGTHMPEGYRNWMAAAVPQLRRAWRQAKVWGPLEVRITLVKARPTERPRPTPKERAEGKPEIPKHVWATGQRVRCVATPDVDNGIGSVMDAMEKAGIVGNDSGITDDRSSKFWAARGEKAHVEIELLSLPWTVSVTPNFHPFPTPGHYTATAGPSKGRRVIVRQVRASRINIHFGGELSKWVSLREWADLECKRVTKAAPVTQLSLIGGWV